MKKSVKSVDLPLYQQVKEHIVSKINNGKLQPGMQVEPEVELVNALNVSRMTVNKALRDLVNEGRIIRIQGKGTFVADKKPQSALLEIESIDKVIKARGGVYSCTIHLIQEEKIRPALAVSMDLEPYSSIAHAIILHKENGIPIQLSDRYVNQQIWPQFFDQDFTQITVSEYLVKIAPVSRVEHIVEAMLPEPWISELLKINVAEPCLALHRKTWVRKTVATKSTFYYPGSRHTLRGMFTPNSVGSIIVT